MASTKKAAAQTQESSVSLPIEQFGPVRVSLVRKDQLLGVASVKVAGLIYLTGIRIIQGQRGPFVAMPARKLKSGEYQDIFFPASREAREAMRKTVMAGYAKALGEAKHSEHDPDEDAPEQAKAVQD